LSDVEREKVTVTFSGPKFSKDGIPFLDFLEGLIQFAKRVLGWQVEGKPEIV
jgi:hypothetical protein